MCRGGRKGEKEDVGNRVKVCGVKGKGKEKWCVEEEKKMKRRMGE